MAGSRRNACSRSMPARRSCSRWRGIRIAGSTAWFAQSPSNGHRRHPRPVRGTKVYNPKKVDRTPQWRSRLRSTRSQYASEKGSSTMRNFLPGYADGLKALGQGFVPTSEGIYEEEQSTYKVRELTEEDKLFQIE